MENGPFGSKPIGDPSHVVADDIIEGRITPKRDAYSDDPAHPVFLRAQNIEEGFLRFDDAKRLLPEAFAEEPKAILEDGDLVLTIDGVLLGKAAVHRPGDLPCCVSNHMVRIRHGSCVGPDFLAAYLNGPSGQRQIKRGITGSAIPGLRADAIERIVVPTPPPPKQQELLAALDAARAARRLKLEEAESLLGGLDAFVLEALGLTLPPPDGRTAYAVRLRDARQRFDPDYNSPRFRALRARIEHGKFPSEPVGRLFYPIVSGFAAGGDDQTDDPSIGVPHIRPLNISNTAELHFDGTKMVPRSAIKPGDFLKQGEVLFNNTNSTAWVGKTVVFDTDRECACSNHITRLTLIDKKHSPYYYAALFNALRGLGYFGLLSTNFNNQAGVNVDTLKAVLFPVPDDTTQKQIAAEVTRRRDAARRLREDAVHLWDAAKRRFEENLLGPAT